MNAIGELVLRSSNQAVHWAEFFSGGEYLHQVFSESQPLRIPVLPMQLQPFRVPAPEKKKLIISLRDTGLKLQLYQKKMSARRCKAPRLEPVAGGEPMEWYARMVVVAKNPASRDSERGLSAPQRRVPEGNESSPPPSTWFLVSSSTL